MRAFTKALTALTVVVSTLVLGASTSFARVLDPTDVTAASPAPAVPVPDAVVISTGFSAGTLALVAGITAAVTVALVLLAGRVTRGASHGRAATTG